MTQTKAEQRRLYKERHPEKVKEMHRKYLDRKMRKAMALDPEIISNLRFRLLQDFEHLTRLTFDDDLPHKCELCGEIEDLHIHHMKYIYPIEKDHLIRLCRRCHRLEHQKLHPLTARESASFPVELLRT